MEILLLSVIGLCVGLAGGLFGIGGGIVLIPALTEFYGPDQHRYQAASLIVNFFVAVPAVYQHMRARAIRGRMVIWLMPPVVVSVVLGVALSEIAVFSNGGEAWLRLCFAGFLLFAGSMEGYRMISPGATSNGVVEAMGKAARPVESLAGNVDPAQWTGRDRLRAVAVAAPTGITAGLLGVGGGVVAVPLQRRLLNIPLRIAIANSAAMIVATSFFGAITKNYAYFREHGQWDAMVLAALVAPAAIVGSLAGSRLTHKLPLTILRILFIGLLIVAAIRMGWGAWAQLR